MYSSLSPGISSPTSQTRRGSRCSGLPSASLSTTPTSCTKCQMPTTSRGTAGLSLERDLSGSCWAWRMHHQPTETVLAQGWQGQGGSLSPACLPEGPCVARGSAFSITPRKGVGSPEPGTGDWRGCGAEATSSRTGGPRSAAQSLRDHDRLKFRPGKLAKWATQCHHSAPRDVCDQLRRLP